MWKLLPSLQVLLDAGERVALATVVKASGSAPQQAGARLLLAQGGRWVGTIGGGRVEHEVRAKLRRCLETRRSELLHFDLVRDLAMCCGGSMEVFVESIVPPQRAIIFGAGHVAHATASALVPLEFRLEIVDSREDWLTEARFPKMQHHLLEGPEALEALAPSVDDWIFLLTHDHRLDETLLEACLKLPHHYIGMIGSRRKVFQILQRIAARGPLPSLDRLYAPIGLALGGTSPEAIAVSIAAQVLTLMHDTPANHLNVSNHPALDAVLEGKLTPTDAAAKS